jgi:putative transposase
METGKDHIHLLVKIKSTVSTLAIIRKLKQETTIRLWKKSKRVFERILLKKHTLWNNGYFASLSPKLAKKQPKITY